VVKHGPHRTVYHVTLPGLDLYLKHFRLRDARAWLREAVRPAKARMEFDRALAVAAREIPTITPLGVGETCGGPSDSFLVTRGLENVEPLHTFIEKTLPGFGRLRLARVRHRLAFELGRLIAHMHQAGILHHDLHAANLLVRLDDRDHPCLFLVDLHAVRLGWPLRWSGSRDNLVVLNRWFILRVSRTDRLRFWKAYCRFRFSDADHRLPGSPSRTAGTARDLEQRTWASNMRFWRNRDRRCLGTNRYFEKVRADRTAGHVVRGLDPVTKAVLFADPDEPFRRPGVKLLKDSSSSTVAEFEIPVDGVLRPVIYKRFRVTKWSDSWLALVRASPARRSWSRGHGLRDRCLPTARPLAVLHRRRRGLSYEGYLLTEKIAGAVDLHRWLADLNGPSPAERRAAVRRRIDQLAGLIRELHRRCLSHRDLKAANLLVAGDQVWLIDLVGVRCYRSLPRARRLQNLTRLHASFHQSFALTRTDKLRFLRVYFQWGLLGRGDWKTWWRNIDRATWAKAARNRRRGRPLA
jgi:tRNA A-37 threonylcarbamoyl transferase component Bud32